MLSWQHCLGKIIKFNVMQVVICVIQAWKLRTNKQAIKQTSKPTGNQNTKHPNCQTFAPRRDEALLIEQRATATTEFIQQCRGARKLRRSPKVTGDA